MASPFFGRLQRISGGDGWFLHADNDADFWGGHGLLRTVVWHGSARAGPGPGGCTYEKPLDIKRHF